MGERELVTVAAFHLSLEEASAVVGVDAVAVGHEREDDALRASFVEMHYLYCFLRSLMAWSPSVRQSRCVHAVVGDKTIIKRRRRGECVIQM